MSLINKMLKDLEKRGVKPPKSIVADEQTTTADSPTAQAYEAAVAAANAEADTDTDNVDTNTAVAVEKKKPSRIIIYSVILLAVYLMAYALMSQDSNKLFKQSSAPALANTYQPKAVTPLHQASKQANKVDNARIAAEIEAAIQAELQTTGMTDETEIKQILSEAEVARKQAIESALSTQLDGLDTINPNKALVTLANKNKAAQTTPIKTDLQKTSVAVAPIAERKPAARIEPVVVGKKAVKKAVAKTSAPKKAVQKVANVSKPKKAKVAVKTPVEVHKPAPVIEKNLEEKLAEATVMPIERHVTAPTQNTTSQSVVSVTRSTPTAQKANIATQQTNIVKTLREEHKATAKYQKALKYVQQGRVSEAQTLLTETLELNPEHQDARQTLAALLLDNQRTKAAKDVLKEGLMVNPNQTAFRMAVARLEVELGNPNLALQTLLDGKKVALNNATYQAFLGTLLQGQNRHEEAITHFQNALNADGSLSNVLIGMGVSLQALDRFGDAKVAFQKAQYNTRLPGDLKRFIDYRLKEVEQKISSK